MDPHKSSSKAKQRVFLLLSDYFVLGKIISEDPRSYEYDFGQSLGQCTVTMREKPVHDLYCIDLSTV